MLLIKSSFHFCCVLFPLCVLPFLFLIQLFPLSKHSGVITRSELLLSLECYHRNPIWHAHTHTHKYSTHIGVSSSVVISIGSPFSVLVQINDFIHVGKYTLTTNGQRSVWNPKCHLALRGKINVLQREATSNLCVCVFLCMITLLCATKKKAHPALPSKLLLLSMQLAKESTNWKISFMIPLIKSMNQPLSLPIKSLVPSAPVGLTGSACNSSRPLPLPVPLCVSVCQSPSSFLFLSCAWLTYFFPPHSVSFESLINVPEGQEPFPTSYSSFVVADRKCKRRLLTFLRRSYFRIEVVCCETCKGFECSKSHF